MFRLHSDLTRAIVVAGMLHSVWSELATKGSTLDRPVATLFAQNYVLVQHLFGIYILQSFAGYLSMEIGNR